MTSSALGDFLTKHGPFCGGIADYFQSAADRAQMAKSLFEEYGISVLTGSAGSSATMPSLRVINLTMPVTASSGGGHGSRTDGSMNGWARGMSPETHGVRLLRGGAPVILYMTRFDPFSDSGACFCISRRPQSSALWSDSGKTPYNNNQNNQNNHSSRDTMAIVPDIVVFKMFFRADVFEGTILDGELVRVGQKGMWTFNAFDILVDRGFKCEGLGYHDRLDRLNEIVKCTWRADKGNDLFALRVDEAITIPQLAAHMHMHMHPMASTSTTTKKDEKDGKKMPSLRDDVRAMLFFPWKPTRALKSIFVIVRKGMATNASHHQHNQHNQHSTSHGRHGHKSRPIASIASIASGTHPVAVQTQQTQQTPHPPASTTGHQQQAQKRMFWVRRTHLSDVFEVHNSEFNATKSLGDGSGGVMDAFGNPMTACVSSLKISLYLNNITNCAKKVASVEMQWDVRFQRWVPCIPEVSDIQDISDISDISDMPYIQDQSSGSSGGSSSSLPSNVSNDTT